MLQAQIAIVDESGHTEESMTILGSGRVSLGARQTNGYLHADEAEPDLAVIRQDGERVWIHIKVANALQRDNVFIAPGSFDLPSAQDMTAFVGQLHRYIRVTQAVVAGVIITGNAIVHTNATPSESISASLVHRTQASAARGAGEVSRQLQRLRDRGQIDQRGDLLVPWPDDMKPGSKTDL